MTPAEKAQELVDKFYPFMDQDSEWAMRGNSKLCALIAVEELIKSTPPEAHMVEISIGNKHAYELIQCREYWQAVKQELKKL